MKTDKLLHLVQQKKAMRSGGALPLPKAQNGIVNQNAYDLWYKYNTPEGRAGIPDVYSDYDYRKYFEDAVTGVNPMGFDEESMHFPDTYKYPWHPSFSDESIYYVNQKETPGLSYQTKQKGGLTKAQTGLPVTTDDSLRVYNAQMALNKFYADEARKGRLKLDSSISLSDGVWDLQRRTANELKNKNLDFYRGLISSRQNRRGHGPWDDLYEKYFNLTPQQLKRLEYQGIARTNSGTDNVFYYRDLITPLQNLASPFAVLDTRIKPQRIISYIPINDKDDQYPGGNVDVYDYDPLAVKPFYLRTPQEQKQWEEKYGKTKVTSASSPRLTAARKPETMQLMKSIPSRFESSDIDMQPVGRPVPPIPTRPEMYMDMRGEWMMKPAISDSVLMNDPRFMQKSGYRKSEKKSGGLAKAQNGLPVNNPHLPNTPLATGAAESVMGLIDYFLLPSQLPLKAATALGRGAITLAEILNPLGGFRPSTDMLYRGIGKEGFEDAMESGVLRAAQHNYPAKRSIAEIVNSPKQFDKVYYSPDAEAAMRYGQGYVAAVPKTAADFVNRYKGKGKDWSQLTSRQIPIKEATIFQKYPIVGYKKKFKFQDAGESGLQYVPSGDYGRYYDPETKEYVPEVYLPDVEISASKDLPFQNNRFAPFLASRGMAENSVFDDPIALAMFGAFRAGKPLVEGLKQFGKNVASEATMGVSDFSSNIGKQLRNIRYLGKPPIDPNSPEFKIQQLQTEGFLPEFLSEEGVQDLIRNPNLLDLAVRRKVKDRLTVARTVRPGTEAVSSSGTITPFASDDMRMMQELGADVSPETQALYMGTRIPFERYGYRAGAEQVPYPDYDVLYHYRNRPHIADASWYGNVSSDVRKSMPQSLLDPGVDKQYGTHTVFSRYPFDFSGSADDLVRRYKQFEKSKSSQFISEIPRADYTGKLIDTGDEAFVIGKPGQRVLDPIKVVSTPRLRSEYDQWFSDWKKVNRSIKSDFADAQNILEKYTGVRPKNEEEAWKLASDMSTEYQTRALDMRRPKPADISTLHYSPFKFKFQPGGLTKSKAREILHDKSVHGHPLTDKQRKFFGAIASGKSYKVRVKKNKQ